MLQSSVLAGFEQFDSEAEMKPDELRTRTWQLSCVCDVNQRYHQTIAWRWGCLDKLVKIVVALLAVMALVLTFQDHGWEATEVSVAALAAIAAVALNVVPVGEWATESSERFRAWTELRIEAEILHLKAVELQSSDATPAHLIERLADLNSKQFQLDASEPAPWVKLLAKCQGDHNESIWGAGLRTFSQVECERQKRLGISDHQAFTGAAEAVGSESAREADRASASRADY